MGTWGTGAFDNDDALDLLDTLTEQDAAGRHEALERILRKTQERPEDLGWTFSASQVVAAVAVVAAGLPTGEAVLREITKRNYEAAILIPENDPALIDAALAALLIAAGHDGAWHENWVDPGTASQGRRTTDQLASVFHRYCHRHDQGLPLEP